MKAGLILLIGLVWLGGCKGEPKSDAGAGTAQGEVLPGAASDAMLPLDTVKSQAPLAPKSEGGADGEGKAAKVAKPSGKASDAPVDAPEATLEASSNAAESTTAN